jgi:hypothetical protein
MSVTDQLPASAAASNGASNGRVELRERGLYIEATFCNDALLQFVKDGGLGSNPVRQIEDLCVLGLLSSRAGASHAVAVETRRAETALRTMFVTEAEQYLRSALRRAVGSEGEDGAFLPELEKVVSDSAQLLESVSGRLLAELNGSGEKALPQVLDRRVRETVRDVVQNVLQRVFASDGALAANLKSNADAIKDLRADLMKLQEIFVRTATAAEQVDPARAGREWQPSTLDAIAKLTHITGDRLEETGDTPGHGRSKRGDGVIHVAFAGARSEPKVAVECRTGAQVVSVRDLIKARENRSAEVALLVAECVSALPKDARPLGFRVYLEESVVVLRYAGAEGEGGVLLATAVQVARHLAQLSVGSSSAKVDRTVLQAAVRRIEACLGRVKPLRGSVTGIETEASRIRGYVQDIEREARGAVVELAMLIHAKS